MITIRSRRRLPSSPLSAMSDIGFLLLIFIMLLSLINYRKELKIDYPEAKHVARTEAEHQLEIWIDRDGHIFWDGRMLEPPALEQIIAESYVDHPDTRIHVLADRNTAFKDIEPVISLLQILQHRVVSFVVQEDL